MFVHDNANLSLCYRKKTWISTAFTLTGKFESQQISKFKFGFSSVNILVYFNLSQDIKLQNTNNYYNYDEQYQKEKDTYEQAFKKNNGEKDYTTPIICH